LTPLLRAEDALDDRAAAGSSRVAQTCSSNFLR
jgi:hypothetical protein